MVDVSFVNDPRWNSLDDNQRQEIVGRAFERDVMSDERWTSLAPEEQAEVRNRYNQQVTSFSPAQETQIEEMGDLQRGWESGVQQTQAGLYGMAGLAGSILGADDLKAWGFEGYRRNMEEAAKYPTKRFTEIASAGDAVDYVQGLIGNLAPSMIEASAGAFLTGGIGYGVAKQGVKSAAKKLAAKAVMKLDEAALKGMVKREVIDTATKEAAQSVMEKSLLSGMLRGWAKKGANIKKQLGKAGMVTAVAALEAGSNYGEVLDEHGIDAPFSALGFGTLAASLELMGGNSKLIDVFVDGIAKGAPGNFLKRAAKEILTNAPQEALQEAGQETLSVLNTVVNTDEKFLTKDNLLRIFESGMAGAVAGTGGGILQSFAAPNESNIGNAKTVDEAVKSFEETLSAPFNFEQDTGLTGEALYEVDQPVEEPQYDDLYPGAPVAEKMGVAPEFAAKALTPEEAAILGSQRILNDAQLATAPEGDFEVPPPSATRTYEQQEAEKINAQVQAANLVPRSTGILQSAPEITPQFTPKEEAERSEIIKAVQRKEFIPEDKLRKYPGIVDEERIITQEKRNEELATRERGAELQRQAAPKAQAAQAGLVRTTPKEPAPVSKQTPQAVQAASIVGGLNINKIKEELEQIKQKPGKMNRRVNEVLRKKMDELSPDEMKIALQTDSLTGLKNKRAYNEAEKMPVQASIDADSLKWVNDNIGHEAGDELLRHIGDALRHDNAYHISGDEFVVEGKTEEEVDAVIETAQKYLDENPIGFELDDGTVVELKGAFSYGKGKTFAEADKKLKEAKTARELSGDRAARGEKPRAIVQGESERKTGKTEEAEPEAQFSEDIEPEGKQVETKDTRPSRSRSVEVREAGFRKTQLDRTLGKIGDSSKAKYVLPKTSKQRTVHQIGRLFGLDVKFFETKDEKLNRIHGFTVPGKREVYINTSAGKPEIAILGHETVHKLNQFNPKAYAFLVSELMAQTELSKFESYKARRNKAIKKRGGETLATAKMYEEFIADFAAEQFQRPEFWNQMYIKSPTFTQQIVNVIKDLVNRIRSVFSQVDTNAFKDKKQAQQSLAKAMSEMTKVQNAVAKGRNQAFESFSEQAIAPVFYSKMQQVIEKKLTNANADMMRMQLESWADKGEFKKEELEWSGVLDWLKEKKGKVKKQAVLDYLEENKVEIVEVPKGSMIEVKALTKEDKLALLAERAVFSLNNKWSTGDQIFDAKEDAIASVVTDYEMYTEYELDEALGHSQDITPEERAATKFQTYQLPGGKDYSELLLTLPEVKHTKETRRKAAEAIVDDLYEIVPLSEIRVGNFSAQEYGAYLKDSREEGKTWDQIKENADEYMELAWAEIDNAKSVEEAKEQLIAWVQQENAQEIEYAADALGLTYENFTTNHWSEPNVLAHVRFSTREIDGKKVLHVEEVQSDWHQAGRKKGYKIPVYEIWVDGNFAIGNLESKEAAEKELQSNLDEGLIYDTSKTEIRKGKAEKGVPDAPFKKTWPILVMKRMVRYAAENDYDALAWTQGKEQAERYQLSTRINSIQATPVPTVSSIRKEMEAVAKDVDEELKYNPDGSLTVRSFSNVKRKLAPLAQREWEQLRQDALSYVEYPEPMWDLSAYDKHDELVFEETLTEDKMRGTIGDALTDKIIGKEKGTTQISGIDLDLGGEGMKGFYDKILPAEMNKMFNKKAWGKAKVEEIELDSAASTAAQVIAERIEIEGFSEDMPASWEDIIPDWFGVQHNPNDTVSVFAMDDGAILSEEYTSEVEAVGQALVNEDLISEEDLQVALGQVPAAPIVNSAHIFSGEEIADLLVAVEEGEIPIHEELKDQLWNVHRVMAGEFNEEEITEFGEEAWDYNDAMETFGSPELHNFLASKQTGVTVYEGPTLTVEELTNHSVDIERQDWQDQISDIQNEMEVNGAFFEYAVLEYASPELVESWGGELIAPKAKIIKLHSMLITDEMKDKIPYESLPQFSEDIEPEVTALTEDDYKRNREIQTSIKEKAVQNIMQFKNAVGKMADEYLGSISTRLKNINPKIANRLRKLDFDINTKATGDVKKVEPLMRKARKKMSRSDFADWDYARKNSDTTKINELLNKYDLNKEYKDYRAALDDIRKKALDVGMDVGYIEDYTPRVLKDATGFLQQLGRGKDWAIISQRLREEADRQGLDVNELTTEQKADIVSNMILRPNYGLAATMRPRKLQKLQAELNKFYLDSDAATMAYIHNMRSSIATRRFFGRVPDKIAQLKRQINSLTKSLSQAQDKASKDWIEDDLKLARKRLNDYKFKRDFTDNIGEYVREKVEKGEVPKDKERELIDILNARFNEKGMSGLPQAYKNLSYIDTMGSPTSAITQIGDLAWAMYVGGIFPALKHAYKAITKSSEITKEDVGIERIAQEFVDPGTLGKAVNKVFKMVGLEKMDAIGKESLLNTALDEYRKRAKNGDKKLKAELQQIFENDTDSVLADLKNNKITENVKLLVYHKLLDFQPVAMSEMPQKYLTAGNGRLFYMLKSFTLKQFDVFRREAFQKIKSKDPTERVQGVKNLIMLSSIFILANASADELKDWLLQRDTELSDRVVDNTLRLFGISKFVTWKARTEGVGSAVMRQVAPPFKFIDALTKDIVSAGDERGLETLSSVPVLGKLAYWHMGRGRSKRQDLWDRRFKVHKQKLNKVKEGLEKADDKDSYKLKHYENFKKLRETSKLQTKLNNYRTRINKLQGMPKTEQREETIKVYNEARTNLIKRFLEENA